MRRVALIGVVVLIAVLTWISTRSSTERTDAVPEPSPIKAAETLPISDLDAVESSADMRTVPTQEVVEELPARVSQKASAPLITLHGTVVVLDERGVEHKQESGQLDVMVWKRKQGSSKKVEVAAGAWQIDVESDAKYSIGQAVLGARTAFPLESKKSVAIPPDRRVEARMRWLPLSILHVRDAASGRELSGIEVLPTNELPLLGQLVPERQTGPYSLEIRGDSPLTLRAEDFTRSSGNHAFVSTADRLFARAPGYAWSSTGFDLEAGGEYFIELTPSATLDIEVVGERRSKGALVRVWKPDQPDRSFQRTIGSESQLAIEGLSAGRYVVAAMVPVSLTQTRSVVEVEVVLVPGASNRAVLELPPETVDVRADMSGVLIVPSAWGQFRPRLRARCTSDDGRGYSPLIRLEKGESTPAADAWSWSATNAPIGKYEIRCTVPPHAIDVELPAGGKSGIRMELPPPADVVVHVVDAATGLPTEATSVYWKPSTSSIDHQVGRDASSQLFEFRCPVGQIEVMCRGDDKRYATATMTADIHLGPNVVTLTRPLLTGVRISLMDGSTLVMGDITKRGLLFEVMGIDGGGRMTRTTSSSKDSAVHVFVSKPGRYRIRLREPLPGYLSPDEQLVDIADGTITELVIQLVRQP